MAEHFNEQKAEPNNEDNQFFETDKILDLADKRYYLSLISAFRLSKLPESAQVESIEAITKEAYENLNEDFYQQYLLNLNPRNVDYIEELINYKEQEKVYYHDENFITSYVVLSDGTLLLGTDKGNVQIYKPSIKDHTEFFNYELVQSFELSTEKIENISPFADGSFSCQEGGQIDIFKYDEKGIYFQTECFPDGDKILCAISLENGDIFTIDEFGNGNIFSQYDGKFKRIKHQKLIVPKAENYKIDRFKNALIVYAESTGVNPYYIDLIDFSSQEIMLPDFSCLRVQIEDENSFTYVSKNDRAEVLYRATKGTKTWNSRKIKSGIFMKYQLVGRNFAIVSCGQGLQRLNIGKGEMPGSTLLPESRTIGIDFQVLSNAQIFINNGRALYIYNGEEKNNNA